MLHLEGEEELVHLMMRENCNATEHYINMGKKQQPKNLIQLLEEHCSHEFKGVMNFDSDLVPALYHAELPKCWALAVVTLTSIALALPDIDKDSINHLLHRVGEGLMYVELIEDNLNSGPGLSNVRKAANVVWLGLDLYHRWMGLDLQKLCSCDSTWKDVLESLSDISKKTFVEFKETSVADCMRDSTSAWPIRVLAAYSMYRITQTMLLDDHRKGLSSKAVFETVVGTISDILGACLTNLERVISMECCRSSIEERQKCVQRAGILLGRSEKVIKILNRKAVPVLSVDQKGSLDEWRASCWVTTIPFPLTSLEEGVTETDTKHPGDLYLPIQ